MQVGGKSASIKADEIFVVGRLVAKSVLIGEISGSALNGRLRMGQGSRFVQMEGRRQQWQEFVPREGDPMEGHCFGGG